MKSSFLRPDPAYRDLLEHFTVRDSVIALGFYALIMVIYYVIGWLLAHTGNYYGTFVNICLMLLPVLICRRLSVLGLTGRNLRRSLLVSGIIGLVFLMSFTIIPGIISHAKLLPAAEIVRNMLYYFLVIGLSEEISFRGFIQPRLYPLLKREWLMILIGGILFVLMHYPFQMAARGMSVMEYFPLFMANAPMQFLWHLAFTALYRRYGNIFGSTLLHGCVDMSMGIFG